MAGQISWFFLLAFIGANLLSTFAADVEKNFCGGICLRIKKKSGAFSAVRCGKGKKKDFGAPKYDKAFELKMESIEQQDNDGKKVGQRVDKDSIDKQDFDFTPLNRTAKYHGLKAVHVGLKGHLKGPQAFLHVDAYVFCEAGNITFGNETFEVQNGTLKLFFKLDNYTFCNGSKTALCEKDQVAEFGEIALSVKTRDGRTPTKDDAKGGQIKKRAQNKMKCRSKRCPIQLRFLKENGDEDEDPDQMVAASKCKRDGKFVNMSGDFPKIVVRAKKPLLVFRFPKFVDSVVIDPGLTLSETGDDDDGKPGEPTEPSEASSIQLNVFMFIIMVTTLFMFM